MSHQVVINTQPGERFSISTQDGQLVVDLRNRGDMGDAYVDGKIIVSQDPVMIEIVAQHLEFVLNSEAFSVSRYYLPSEVWPAHVRTRTRRKYWLWGPEYTEEYVPKNKWVALRETKGVRITSSNFTLIQK
jgi:hypothetical protein